MRSAPTKDLILMGLVSNHNLVFGKEDLLSKPLETNEWYRFLNEVIQFVDQNARADATLLRVFDAILENTDMLITNIKVVYNVLCTSSDHMQENVAFNALAHFEDIIEELKELQQELTQQNYFYASKKEVKEILLKLALFIEVTAQKAAHDLQKRLAYDYL